MQLPELRMEGEGLGVWAAFPPLSFGKGRCYKLVAFILCPNMSVVASNSPNQAYFLHFQSLQPLGDALRGVFIFKAHPRNAWHGRCWEPHRNGRSEG